MYCKKIILFISKRLPYIFSHFPYYSYFFLLKSAILIIVITNYHNNTASLCRPKRFSNQERRSPMTLREIAAEAGVSISTVSRVINQNTKSPVSKEVQDRIWEIAKRTNYVPRHSKKNTSDSSDLSSTEQLHSIACLFARVPDGASDYFRRRQTVL